MRFIGKSRDNETDSCLDVKKKGGHKGLIGEFKPALDYKAQL